MHYTLNEVSVANGRLSVRRLGDRRWPVETEWRPPAALTGRFAERGAEPSLARTERRESGAST